VLDLVGASAASGFPGHSLVARLGAAAAYEPEPIVSWVDGEITQPEWFPVHEGPLKSVILRKLRYIVDRRGREELYRLDDPLEQRNLAADPAYAGDIAVMRRVAAEMARPTAMATK
jgi:hypothetical protein